jgi:hypothetical protein
MIALDYALHPLLRIIGTLLNLLKPVHRVGTGLRGCIRIHCDALLTSLLTNASRPVSRSREEGHSRTGELQREFSIAPTILIYNPDTFLAPVSSTHRKRLAHELHNPDTVLAPVSSTQRKRLAHEPLRDLVTVKSVSLTDWKASRMPYSSGSPYWLVWG